MLKSCRTSIAVPRQAVPRGCDANVLTRASTCDRYSRGEACVTLSLSPLLKDTPGHDTDGAGSSGVLVRGAAINQDGRSSSLLAPHGPSQQQVPSGFCHTQPQTKSDHPLQRSWNVHIGLGLPRSPMSTSSSACSWSYYAASDPLRAGTCCFMFPSKDAVPKAVSTCCHGRRASACTDSPCTALLCSSLSLSPAVNDSRTMASTQTTTPLQRVRSICPGQDCTEAMRHNSTATVNGSRTCSLLTR